MTETFAVPAVGAIIVKKVGNDEFILVQNRKKNNGDGMDGNKTIMFSPFCVTQNLSGAYSLILSTFLCEAEGELLERTNETENIRWMGREALKEIVDHSPESIFLMHIQALKKYLE